MQRSGFFSASAAATYLFFSDGDEAPPPSAVTVIPIDCPSPDAPVPVRLPGDAAVSKIQSAFRGHLVRVLVRRVRGADAEADRFERLIRQQDTVDAIRRDERERLRLAEGLMAVLLRLDAVPGFYPEVRELRRAASRRVVALQELLDAIAGERLEGVEGFPATWEEVVWGVELEGGCGKREVPVDEEERAVKRGMRCLERFLLGGLV